MSQIIPKVFYTLCNHFFYEDGTRAKFKLESKSISVSDPFVEYLEKEVLIKLKKIKYIVAPLHISPDLAFYEEENKLDNIFGIEVKTSKNKSGDINFNSTPPCGKIIIEVDEKEETVSSYYLFVQLSPLDEENSFEIGTMMLIDGDFINSDFDLYLEAIGIREKRIDLGSYGDGMDRQRPMFVFPNPLGISGLRSERSTLISKERFGSLEFDDEIGMVAVLNREGKKFFAYQAVRNLNGPFVNVTRSTSTKIRNKLKIKTKKENTE